MDAAWIDEVDRYLESLEAAIDGLEASLAEFNRLTAAGQFRDLETPAAAVAESSSVLQRLLDQRAALLQSAPVGNPRPRSLRSALRKTGDKERMERAEQLARRIELQRQNAVTQFVTQYQLADTTSQLIRILTHPGPSPGTYGPQRPATGGNLLDGAA